MFSVAAISLIFAVFVAVGRDDVESSAIDARGDDGGVWTTDAEHGSLSRVSSAVGRIDAVLGVVDPAPDLLQAGPLVFAILAAGRTMSPIDVSGRGIGDPIRLGADSSVAVGADRVGIVDEQGNGWALSVKRSRSFSGPSGRPTVTGLGSAARVVVTHSGLVVFFSPSLRSLISVTRPHSDGSEVTPSAQNIGAFGQGSHDVQLSAVGDRPVLLDPSARKLYVGGSAESGRVVDLRISGIENARSARLQQVGAATGAVAVATRTGLLEQPLNGRAGSSFRFGGSGRPAAPVAVGACIYAAWSEANRHLTVCGTSPTPSIGVISRPVRGAELVFRVNRRVVVLNDPGSGKVWLAQEGFRAVAQDRNAGPSPRAPGIGHWPGGSAERPDGPPGDDPASTTSRSSNNRGNSPPSMRATNRAEGRERTPCLPRIYR